MALTQVLATMGVSAEIGRTSDWITHPLVTPIGIINHDCGELNVVRNHLTGFEIWHPTGLKLKVDFEELLEACADLLAEELEQREP
ncbi:hypothetical protein [Roseibium album]|uniref:hypothetical protein n=1 Tax=Roseibium album TaxID=311410 RepID=UPI0024911380|nr:hypothetical protein [Roseibium album]